ncbi:hypothetical protein PQO01_21080 [Lentisphaera marina]|uniref:hypothetical protein n=1 Tax=Lentisphaera marina TaxID=1111041 RepID=UPI0023662C02|nr:hypothetical protein [Lentisphaera marina]MDD7987454.1 hypothetical protein [Lentisphaera marina]
MRTFLCLLILSVFVQAEETEAYKLAYGKAKSLEKIAADQSSFVREAQGELYYDRVELEKVMKKFSSEFEKIHDKYVDFRTKFTKNRSDDKAKKAYYQELNHMIYQLYTMSHGLPDVAKERKNLIQSRNEYQMLVLQNLPADKQATYQQYIDIINKIHGHEQNI